MAGIPLVGRVTPCAPVLADRHPRAGGGQGADPPYPKSVLCLLRLFVAILSPFNRS